MKLLLCGCFYCYKSSIMEKYYRIKYLKKIKSIKYKIDTKNIGEKKI